jgi:hypothetical protein
MVDRHRDASSRLGDRGIDRQRFAPHQKGALAVSFKLTFGSNEECKNRSLPDHS